VVLFDEIEKAHPDVFNTLLQILDDGRLTDGQGRTVDFRNTVIIMTSNLGTGAARKELGFSTGRRTESRAERQALEANVTKALREHFRPEFLNRIDEIIIFEPLTEKELLQIVDLMARDLGKRLAEQGITLRLTEAAKQALVREGYDPVYGARPLRRVIQRQVENQVSKRLLAGDFRAGDTIVVDYTLDGYVFTREAAGVAA
jgi:ATP-dependent Clp protease ATP-binding subunit ClpC